MSGIVNVRSLAIGEGKPKICVPLCESRVNRLIEEAEYAINEGAHVLEWRVDCFEDPGNCTLIMESLEKLRNFCGETPLMCTFRSGLEGGFYSSDLEIYVSTNIALIESGFADIIDLELFTVPSRLPHLIAAAKKKGVVSLVSNHDFKATPASIEIINILHKMEASGADIYKMAFMPQNFGDVLTLMETVYSYTKDGGKQPVAAMSMSKTGSISRIGGEFYGSCMSYASGRNSSAPGQLSIETLAKYFAES